MATSIYGGKHCNRRLFNPALQSHDEDSLGNLLYLIYFYFIIFFGRAMYHRDLSSPTRNWTHAPSTEPPGSPRYSFYWWRIQGGERLSDLPKVTGEQREMSRIRIQTSLHNHLSAISLVSRMTVPVCSLWTRNERHSPCLPRQARQV